MLTPERAFYPPVDELVEPDGLAARRVERLARRSAGRPGDDSAEVCLLNEQVDVDPPHKIVDIDPIEHGAYINPSQHVIDVRTPEQRIDIHPIEQRVHVHPVEQSIHVDPVQERIHIHSAKDFIDVDPTEYLVQVDSLHEIIDIKRAHEQVDYALGNPLRERLHRVGHSLAYRPEPVARIHRPSIDRYHTLRIIRPG